MAGIAKATASTEKYNPNILTDNPTLVVDLGHSPLVFEEHKMLTLLREAIK
jgi:hypothetical protein